MGWELIKRELIERWDSGNLTGNVLSDHSRNLIVDGNYVYGVTSRGKDFVIYDITIIDVPVQKSLIAMTHEGCDLRKKGNYVFISNNYGTGITVMDVSDPLNPFEDNIFNMGGAVHGMFLVGNYLYCCQFTTDTFEIVDVTDPTNPVSKGSLSGAVYFNGPHDVHVDGIYAYVANYLSGVGEYGITVVNISDVDNPAVVTGVDENEQHSHITKSGDYIYVGCHSPSDELTIYDVSDPSTPSFVGRFFSGEGVNFAYWMDWWNGYLVSTSQKAGEVGIRLINVDDPSVPFIEATATCCNAGVACVYFASDRIFASTKDLVAGTYWWRIKSYEVVETGDEWYRRKKHTVNQEVGAGTNYQILIKVYKGAGTDGTEVVGCVTAGKVYCGGNCQDDFGDIRFTDSTGNELLDYWMEELSSGNYALFWVEVSGDLDVGNVDIYVYYDTVGATVTTSDGTETFLLFDDFDDGSIGDIWGTVGTPTEAGTEVTINASTEEIYSIATFQYKAMKAKVKVAAEAADNSYQIFGFANAAAGTWANTIYFVTYDGDFKVTSGDAVGFEQTSFYNSAYFDSYHLYNVFWKSGQAKCCADGVVVATHTTRVPSIAIPVRIYDYLTVADLKVDWVFVRNYVDPEPTHDTWGGEERPFYGERSSVVPLMRILDIT